MLHFDLNEIIQENTFTCKDIGNRFFVITSNRYLSIPCTGILRIVFSNT